MSICDPCTPALDIRNVVQGGLPWGCPAFRPGTPLHVLAAAFSKGPQRNTPEVSGLACEAGGTEVSEASPLTHFTNVFEYIYRSLRASAPCRVPEGIAGVDRWIFLGCSWLEERKTDGVLENPKASICKGRVADIGAQSLKSINIQYSHTTIYTHIPLIFLCLGFLFKINRKIALTYN
jgi:hypothetical protein